MKKTMKIVAAVVSFAAITGMANAATQGSYVGLGLGMSSLNTPKSPLVGATKSSRTSNGAAGRVFGGYNFNQYVGVEAGVAHYAPSTYKDSNSVATAKRERTLNTFDVVGKGYLPLGASNVDVYGLAGAAYAVSESTVKMTSGSVTVKNSKTNKKVRPVVGAGVGYNMPESNLVANLEYTYMQGIGNAKTSMSAIPAASLVSLNLAYNLG